MAFRAVFVLFGVFVCSICVKGSSQPQARVYLTFDGKKVDKYYGKMSFENFLNISQPDPNINNKLKVVKY